MRVPDAELPAVLGIAAVRRPVRRRREEPADAPARQRIGGCGTVVPRRIHEPRERAGEALRHHHHDLHRGIERPEQVLQLVDRERLAPERDRVVRRVLVVLLAVVGHVEEQRVAAAEAAPLLDEPRAQPVETRRPKRVAVDARADVVDLRSERSGEIRREEPRAARRCVFTDREIGARILAVGAEDRDLCARNAGVFQDADQRPYVLEVRPIVDLAPTAAVHEHDVHAGRDDCCRRSGGRCSTRRAPRVGGRDAAGRRCHGRGGSAGHCGCGRRRCRSDRRIVGRGRGGERRAQHGEDEGATGDERRHRGTVANACAIENPCRLACDLTSRSHRHRTCSFIRWTAGFATLAAFVARASTNVGDSSRC